MIKLVLTDFDGTLVNKDILDVICGINGHEEESRELNEAFINGKLEGLISLKTRIDFLKGITLEQINDKLNENSYLINGAEKLFRFLKDNSIESVLHSGNILPVLYYYKLKLGITNIIGTKPRMNGNVINGIEMEDFNGKNFKYDECKELIDKSGINKNEILAIGDSPADSKVFELAGTKLVINPKGGIEKQADYIIKDLFEVIDIIKKI